MVEGDVLFDSSGMHFRDFDRGGFDDLVTITGMQIKGAHMSTTERACCKESTLLRSYLNFLKIQALMHTFSGH